MAHQLDTEADTKPADDLVVTNDRANGVRVLTLNSARSRNALSMAMMRLLHQAIVDASHDDDVRAVVLAAKGPAFCAGHDLKELTAHRTDQDNGAAFFQDTMRQCAELMQAIVHSPKPVVAAVHAMATAAGCQLVASCDLAVAGRAAKFCTPGVNIGLFCSTPMVALSRNVPRKRAMEMLLLGDVISADVAADYGLVNTVVPDEQVFEGAIEMADIIASKSGQTVAIGKQAFYQQAEMGLKEAYEFTADVMVRNMLAKDAEEGIAAFLEKRPPKWQS